eukprot:TRINITY_DN4502_c0_g1_i1.p1 TRINITY_DN4502_c0_g1~~TRINITY_DN4502_c0_g1_i1.p1  ORF type:complete len:592 (-),score=221.15 TRINITY_DN4502_c0_g1_i1:71-1681(-)
MSKKEDAVIKDTANQTSFTKITFKPDLAKFGLSFLDKDNVALMTKRVYDIAGCNPGLKVTLNGSRLPIKTFLNYVEMHLPKSEDKQSKPIYYKQNRWEIAVLPSDGQFKQVSFVNYICTTKGGTHVDHITGKIVKHLATIAAKKKAGDLKPFQIKNHMWVFVNSLIENPAFDSQTKDTLTTKQSSFGSSCNIPEDFYKKVSKCGIVDMIVAWAKFKEGDVLKKLVTKTTGRISGIAKLDEANMAGRRGHARKCTLILTEGDSAKSLAVSGLAVVGRDYYGVFPLRGKLLNVRDAPVKQISENAELNAIRKILGLKHAKVYTSLDELRYGHLMIMTDQDHDGSHIKGLVINFIHHFWPSLLKIPGFLNEFITPIIKVSKGKTEKPFYTIPEFESWKDASDGAKGWNIKYYKGLGTSTPLEAKEYFRALSSHKIDFQYVNEKDDDSINLAFSKHKIEQRKEWLANFVPGTYLNQRIKKLPYADFINKELILFSMADNIRSIPSLVDGLKPGQRKVLFCAFKRNLKSEVKVIQFSGYVG